MSLLAKVEQLLAEESDGLLKSVKAVAAHVEQLAAGAPVAMLDPVALEQKLIASFETNVTAFLDERKAQVDAKLAELEGEVSAALAKLQPAPAAPPADPAQSPQPVQEQAPQPAA